MFYIWYVCLSVIVVYVCVVCVGEHENTCAKVCMSVQWNLSYPDPTYPDSRLTELGK